MRIAVLTLTLAISMGALSVPVVAEGRITGTGTRVENDVFGTMKHWGRPLSVQKDGTIVRVMGGSYGFQILDGNENVVGDFLFPEQAVGFRLPAGEYSIMPLICRLHRHHHVEVTVEY